MPVPSDNRRLSVRSLILIVLTLGAFSLPLSAEDKGLKTTEATTITLARERILDAKVEAVHQATVSAQTSGRVIKINFDVDDFVEKGEVLLQFRDKEQRARFDAALAGFKEAEAEYNRIKDIFNKKLIAKAVLDKAEAHLKSSQALLDQAKEELENTQVRAPYSGIVVKRHIEVGESARTGQALFTGLSLEQLRATVDVPQAIIHTVRRRQQARVMLDTDGMQSVPAQSLTISPYADPESHSFKVRVNLPRGPFGIYPGMYTKVAFTVGEVERLVVPLQAVARRSEVSAVYVVDKNDRITMRQVRLGQIVAGERVEVLAGLSQGERIALDPVAAIVGLKDQQAGKTE